MDPPIGGRLAPDVVLHPLAVFDSPNARVSESIGSFIKLSLTYVHILQPALQVAPGFYMIILANHFNPLCARHNTRADVLTRMIGPAPVTEFNKFHVIM